MRRTDALSGVVAPAGCHRLEDRLQHPPPGRPAAVGEAVRPVCEGPRARSHSRLARNSYLEPPVEPIERHPLRLCAREVWAGVAVGTLRCGFLACVGCLLRHSLYSVRGACGSLRSSPS